MGFEYAIDYDCQVKQQIGLEKLASLIKSKSEAEVILKIERGEGNTRPASEIKFTKRLQGPKGVEDKVVNVQELLDQSAVLTELEHHCVRCLANTPRRPFGCYGSIGYPIQGETEEWLMDQLTENIASIEGQFMVQSMKDLKFDGKPIRALRGKGPFFDLAIAPKRSWGSWLSKKTITSDQVWQSIMCIPVMEPTHALMMCLILGLLPSNLTLVQFHDSLTNLHRRFEILDPLRMRVSGGNRQIEDLRMYLQSMARAAMMDEHLTTSY